MCGIAGILPFRAGSPGSRERIADMTAALHHRGPDESGLYLDDHAALGHARLSIIDLSGGTQPMHNEDKTLWIVFNGEIFNYLELREELIAKGHRFYTTSDTETILHQYEEKGAACVKDFNGQFAFAIWDTIKRSCFLARDRVGIRPLYYTETGSEFIFASEIKSIFTNPGIPREIDPVAMDQSFTFWAPLPGRTPFKRIRELPAGHHLTVRNGEADLVRYWSMPFVPKEQQLDWSPDRICDEIQSRLKEATRIRLRADVPIGTYLSGGLDSSGITAIVAQNFNSNVQTFGIRFENADYDEGTYQREMVRYLGVNHTELCASDADISAALPAVVWHSEKPLLRTAPVPLYLLSKEVRRHDLKVVLTGEGSDEIFGGYNIFREALVRRFWSRFPKSDRRAGLVEQLYPYIFKDPKLRPMMRAFFARGLEETDDPLYSHRLRWENTARIKGYFSEDLKAAIGSYSGLQELRETLPDEFRTWDHLAQAQYLESSLFLSNYLLSSQGDRVAMGNSIEIRLPFLDVNVMEFMGRVPAVWKILGLKEKYLLKKSFRGTLPDSIALRPKHPYRAPAPLLNEPLLQAARHTTGLFDPARVGQLIKKAQAAPALSETDSMALTGILTAQILHNQYIETFAPHRADAFPPALVIDRRTTAKETPS